MYVCERVRHTHTHTHTHFILAVSRCLPSLPISTLTLSLAQVPSSDVSPPPRDPEFPAEPSLLEVPSSSPLIGLHLPHQPHLHVDTLLSCLGSDPALSCLTPWAQAWRCRIA